MPVQTPQLEEPVYQPQMAAPPMPQGQQAQVLPAQAGFVSKAGAGAYIANNVLQGWLQGRKVKAERNLQRAQTKLAGADYAYQTVAQNYNSLLKQGKSEDDPEVQKAKQAAMSAWNAKLNVMQQYTMPAQPAKKTAKQKVAGGFGQMFGKSGVTPELIAQTSLQVLKSSPPPGLGLSPQDQLAMTQQKEADVRLGAEKLALDQEKRKDADDTKMQAIVAVPEDQRTPEQKQWLDGWQRIQHIKDPESQKFADAIMKKIEGGIALNDTERNYAYAQRMLEGPQIAFRTDAKGTDQMLTYSPDGKVLGTVPLGRHYEPDQVGPMMRLLKAQQHFFMNSFKQAGMSDQNAMQAAILEQTKNPQLVASLLGDSPLVREQQMSMVDKALRSVMAEAGGPGADPALKKKMIEEYSNFIVIPQQNDATGFYAFRDQLAPGKTTGWLGKKTTYADGMTPEDEAATQAALYNRVRAEIQKQNPKLTSLEIDRILPEWLKTPAVQQTTQPGAQPMAAPPPAAPSGPGVLGTLGRMATFPGSALVGGIERLFQAPPASANAAKPGTDGIWGEKKAGSEVYEIETDQGVQKGWMTAAEADQARQSGLKIKKVNRGPA